MRTKQDIIKDYKKWIKQESKRKYDYKFVSIHFLKVGKEYIPVDHSEKSFQKMIRDTGGIKKLVKIYYSDLRKAINVLQASSTTGEKVTAKIVYEVSARARPEEVKEMIKLALSGKFLEARSALDKLIYEYGMSGEDVILQLHRELIDMDEKEVDSKTKIELVDKIGEYNFRMVEGANERIQLEALLAQFLKYKK